MKHIIDVYPLVLAILIPITAGQVLEPTVKDGNKTVIGDIGGSVFLQCQVINPGNNSVSWYYMQHNVRISDNLKVLINSNRYSIEQPRYSDTNSPGNRTVYYSLEIIHLKVTDQGAYYCQLEDINNGRMTYELVIENAKRPSPPINIPIANHTDCCLKEQVSAGCLPICDRSTIDAQFNPALCGGDVVKLIKCGTDGRNHVSCCRRKLVPVECLDLCASAVTSIRPDQTFCDQYDPQINSCYNEGQVTLPTPPRDVTAVSSPEGIHVDWHTPEENSNLVTGYRVSYRSVENNSPTFQTTELLDADSRSKILYVKLGGLYQVYVTAVSPHGSSQPSSVIELYSGPDSDVNSTQNVAIKACCSSHHVHYDCQRLLCKTGGYRALGNHNVQYCQSDMSDIFHCIVGGQDHRACCKSKGLTEQCMGLCSGQIVVFNETLLPCLLQLQKVEECLQEGFAQLPGAPRNVRLESVSVTSAVLEWSPAYLGTSPVDSYTIQYRIRSTSGLIPYTEVVTQGTFAMLTPLRPDTVYEAKVSSSYQDMLSLPTPTVIFQTYPEEPIKNNSSPENHHLVMPDLRGCCQNQNIPDSCLWMCSYDLDFRATLRDNATQFRACSTHIRQMLTCASDHRSHISCCEASLVPDNCLFMCTFGEQETRQDVSVNCEENYGTVLNCYKSGVLSIPRSPVNLTVTNVTAHSISLQWDTDFSGALPSDFVVQYQVIKALSGIQPTIFWLQDVTNLTYHILQNLKSDTVYLVSIVAINENGSSIPTQFIDQLTDVDPNSATIGFKPPVPGTTQNPLVVQPTPPPVNRSECCEAKGVSSECVSACDQSDITNTTCANDIFTTLACSADGADHSACCKHMGVPYECQRLCDGQTEHQNNPVSVLCANYADTVIYCTQRPSVALPSQPTNFRVDEINVKSMRLNWDPPLLNSEGCSYIVYYVSFKENHLNRRYNVPNIQSGRFRLTGLESDTLYQVYVIARNKQGFSQPSTKHLVRTRFQATLQAFVSQVPDRIVEVGEFLSLSCGFYGSPPPYSFKWYFHSRVIHHGQQYRVQNISASDEGMYTCLIENSIETDKAKHYVSIRYKPELVSVKGDMVPPNQLYSAHLQCLFKGHPTQIKWLRDGKPVKEGKSHSEKVRDNINNGQTTAVLELGHIVLEDYGHYTCRGTNHYGMAEGITDLKNPETMSLTTPIPTSPSAANVTACCMTKGVPEDQMKLCSSSINNLSGIRRYTQTLLTVLECTADDRDSRICCQKSHVHSECLPLCAGQSISSDMSFCIRSVSIILDCLVAGQAALPSPPQNLVAHAPHLGEIVLTWEPPKKNPDKVSYYHIYYERMGDPLSLTKISVDGKMNSYKVHVKVQGDYKIWLVAGNTGGQSKNSSMQVASVFDLLPSAPRDLHGQLISRGTVSLLWNHPDVRTAPITNYVVFYRAKSEVLAHNKSTVSVGSSQVLDNLKEKTEYKIYVRGNNTFGLGELSNIIYIDTEGESTAQEHADTPGFNSVAVGVSVTVVILVIIVIVLVAIYFFKVRKGSLKEPGAVSFENPSYAEGNNQIQISDIRNDVPDSTMQPPSTTNTTTNSFDYGKLQDNGHSVPHDVDNPGYATLDVTQTNAVNTQQISVSVDKDISEA